MTSLQAADVTVRIVPHLSAQGHPFSEVLYTYQGHHALTRYWYVVSDTPHARANEAQQFVKRRRREAA